VPAGPSESAPLSVEDALALALERASAAGQWSIVGQIAAQLEARRLTGAGNVVPLAKRSRP
jgi:hypothetical protein